MMRKVVLIAFAASLALFADAGDELLSAARKGDLAAVKAGVEKGAPLEATTPYGQTPLYLAAMNGHEEVVRFLLDKGANPDVRDTFYKASMLEFVLQREHIGVAKALIAKGKGTVDTYLESVVRTGRADLVQAVLDKGKPSQAALDKAMESVAEAQKPEVAEVLKKAGAQPPPPPVQVDPKVLESYAGTYKSDTLPLDIKVSSRDGKLYMQATGQGEFQLKPKSATQFEFTQAGIKTQFQSADSFVLSQGGRDFTFKKAGK